MSGGLPMLAAGDDSLVKIVIGLVVAVIWVAVQAYQKLTEKGDKKLPPSRPPAERRPPPVRQLPQDPPITGQLPQRQNRPKPQRRPQQSPPPVRTPPRLETPGVRAPAAMSELPPARPPRRAVGEAPPASGAAQTLPRGQVVGALLKPRNLKKAFILTEILGPPVAMKGEIGTERRAPVSYFSFHQITPATIAMAMTVITKRSSGLRLRMRCPQTRQKVSPLKFCVPHSSQTAAP
ncbi:MAG: hypothetical protein QM754_13240 [Tepidisphaeraceae bacterium]